MRSLLPSCVVAAVLAGALATSSCAPVLVGLSMGGERGRANLVKQTDADGIVFLERLPREPRATVVLLHGLGGNKDHWTRFAAQLPFDLQVVIPDLPGHGESPHDEARLHDIDSQVVSLERFLRGLGIERCHLMGNSMGGQIAAVFALKHPEQVASLVLFDPAGITPPEKSERDRLMAAGRDPLDAIQTVADFDTLLRVSFVTPPVIPDFVKEHFAQEAVKGAAFTHKVKEDVHAHPHPLLDEVERLVPPTLVLWGDSDGIIHPSAAALWRARVPGHTVVMMAQTGHAPQLERPGESAALVVTWWNALQKKSDLSAAASAPPPAP